MADLLNPIDLPPLEPAKPPVPQIGMLARLRNYFLTGLIVAGPVAVTAWLTWSFIKWVDNLVAPLIPPALRPESYSPVPIPGTGLVIALVGLTLLGFLTANLVGRTLVGWGESLLGRMPIVRPVYKTMKQIFETLFSKSGSSFRKVALVEFPAPGMWSLVFLSQAPSGDISDRLPKKEHVSAFMPCTPNPTTGFFFYVPRDASDRARHHGRERDDFADFRRHGAAGYAPRRANQAGGAGGDRPHGSSGAADHPGEMISRR